MSETIDVDLRSFVDFAERDVRLADRIFPAPEPGPAAVARKLCDLAFEARDQGVCGAAMFFILLARGMICARPDEWNDLIALLSALDCSQELIASWAEQAGVRDAPYATEGM